MSNKKKGLRVLSLCGGIETGLLALEQLNIPILEYHTYEILPEAITVSQKHFPYIVHHGDLIGEDFTKVYELRRALDEIQPKWFMAENVVPSDKDDLEKLNEIMGVEGTLINSNRFVAQDRERYYWTNIPIAEIPESNELVLRDIMETNVDEKYFYKKDFEIVDMNKKVCATLKVNTMQMSKRIYNPNFKCATLTCISGGIKKRKYWIMEYQGN